MSLKAFYQPFQAIPQGIRPKSLPLLTKKNLELLSFIKNNLYRQNSKVFLSRKVDNKVLFLGNRLSSLLLLAPTKVPLFGVRLRANSLRIQLISQSLCRKSLELLSPFKNNFYRQDSILYLERLRLFKSSS